MNAADVAFLAGRIIYGAYFFWNGLNHLFFARKGLAGYAHAKGVPAPGFMVPFSGLFILFGGLAVMTGIYRELGAVLIIVFLLAVSFKMHAFWAIKDPMAKISELVNFTKNMALLGAALMLTATAFS